METDKNKLYELLRKYDVDEDLSDALSSTLVEHEYTADDIPLLCEIDKKDLNEMGIRQNAYQRIFLRVLNKIAKDNSIELVSEDSYEARLDKIAEDVKQLNETLDELKKKSETFSMLLKETKDAIPIVCLEGRTKVPLLSEVSEDGSSASKKKKLQ